MKRDRLSFFWKLFTQRRFPRRHERVLSDSGGNFNSGPGNQEIAFSGPTRGQPGGGGGGTQSLDIWLILIFSQCAVYFLFISCAVNILHLGEKLNIKHVFISETVIKHGQKVRVDVASKEG